MNRSSTGSLTELRGGGCDHDQSNAAVEARSRSGLIAVLPPAQPPGGRAGGLLSAEGPPPRWRLSLEDSADEEVGEPAFILVGAEVAVVDLQDVDLWERERPKGAGGRWNRRA
jgi:hypothetical protein